MSGIIIEHLRHMEEHKTSYLGLLGGKRNISIHWTDIVKERERHHTIPQSGISFWKLVRSSGDDRWLSLQSRLVDYGCIGLALVNARGQIGWVYRP